NASGQLGCPIERMLVPTPVGSLSPVSTLAIGPTSSHTCALQATGPTGAAYCWGKNSEGELGNGSTISASPVPDSVRGGGLYSMISTGLSHTCAVRTTDAGYCWGYNGLGQLGNPTAGTSYQPIPLGSGFTFISIASGLWHTCGITTSGAAYCWGTNIRGELGDSSANSSQSPVAVAGGHTFSAVATGVFASCGLTSSGSAFCWGDNVYHQMGDSITQSSFPRQVAGGVTF